MPLHIADLGSLLGLSPGDAAITRALSALSASTPEPAFETKAYPDATFHNYHTLGLSLCFEPFPSSSSELKLASIDIFNAAAPPASRTSTPYAAPPLPLVIHFADPELVLPARNGGEAVRVPRPPILEISYATPARDIVRRLGEPKRKGSGGWVGVWLEWVGIGLLHGEERADVGIMLELRDPKTTNSGTGGVWDRAAGWPWASIKVFRADAAQA
jgi:hypothetical protein